jgi:hypothetical protein
MKARVLASLVTSIGSIIALAAVVGAGQKWW